MSGLDRFLAALLLGLAVLCVAGIVHIVSVLALPKVVLRDPYALLSALTGPARLHLLPRPQPGSEVVPSTDPAMARGLCLFDLSKAALRLHGMVDKDRLVTLSFRTRAGHVFFSLTDRAAYRGEINVLVLSPQQLEAIEAEPSEEEEPSQELRLVAPSIQGIVFIDALAVLPGEWDSAEQRVRRFACEPEPIPEE